MWQDDAVKDRWWVDLQIRGTKLKKRKIRSRNLAGIEARLLQNAKKWHEMASVDAFSAVFAIRPSNQLFHRHTVNERKTQGNVSLPAPTLRPAQELTRARLSSDVECNQCVLFLSLSEIFLFLTQPTKYNMASTDYRSWKKKTDLLLNAQDQQRSQLYVLHKITWDRTLQQ